MILLSHRKANKMIKLLKNSYHNFTNEITNNDNELFSISNAYYENGVVYLEGTIKAGWSGDKQKTMIHLKYCPRYITFVTLSFTSTNSDQNKISSMYITDNGNVYAWIVDGLSYNERFSAIYPLKSE